ncbi:MAG TPA: asparagine synthase-related protein [Vicinamibacterales bacterium]|nr:asparagine synthase-related protein [Vicinamibacterales bacterium]
MSGFRGHWTFERLPAQTVVIFDGRLDNRAELIAACGHRRGASEHSTDAELALWAYEGFGIDVAAKLLGDFAMALFDPREHRIVLARDSIGVKPLYYRQTGPSLFFGSDIKWILAQTGIQAKPNEHLLAGLMLGRLHRQDDDGTTLFEGISGVPPAHVAIFSPAASVVRQYWDFTGDRESSDKCAGEYADGFRFHFERAVARRIRGDKPTAVAVSGGLDSSSIFCVAHRLAADAHPPVGLTYTHRDGSPADETRYVADLERYCGQHIRHVDHLVTAGLTAHTEALIRRVEAPMIAADSHVNDRLLAAAHEAGAGAVLTGHWGDQMLFDQAYLIDLLHRGAWRSIASHLRAYPEWFPDTGGSHFRRRLLIDFLQYDMPQELRRPMRVVRRAWKRPAPWRDWFSAPFLAQLGPDEFARGLSGGTGTILACALYREVRSRYHGLCLEWHAKMAAAHGMDAAFPFLDRDLIEFLMGVPGEILARDGMPKALLRDGLAGVVPETILSRRSKGDFTEAANRTSRKDYPGIVRLLGPDSCVVQAGYVDADKLHRGLRGFEGLLDSSTSCAASWGLTAVMALEIWLREFFGNAQGEEETTKWTSHAQTTR